MVVEVGEVIAAGKGAHRRSGWCWMERGAVHEQSGTCVRCVATAVKGRGGREGWVLRVVTCLGTLCEGNGTGGIAMMCRARLEQRERNAPVCDSLV